MTLSDPRWHVEFRINLPPIGMFLKLDDGDLYVVRLVASTQQPIPKRMQVATLPFSGGSTLAAASSRSFTATLGTATAGTFSASYTLSFSDENLPGATTLSGLTLMLMGIVQPATVNSADFNGDGNVDGDDFLTWQRGLGNMSAALGDGDANGDHIVNEQDLAIWRAQFGGASTPLAQGIPEPRTVTLLLITASLSFCRQRRSAR